MNQYRVSIDASAKKVLKGLPSDDLLRIAKALDGLAENPYPPRAKNLKGVQGLLRLRVGEYRIIYTVQKSQLIVLVLKIGNRRDVYRGL